MFRQLKHHESKLLKKTNFYSYKSENNHREMKVTRKYQLTDREDYERYNKVCGLITQLVAKVKQLSPTDPFRIKISEQLLNKLYDMGLITNKQDLTVVQKLSVSAFCRRRMSVVVQSLKFVETLKEATTFIEQGHLRVGPKVVTDPAMLVTRPMEDHLNWVDSSKIKQKIMKFKDRLDDYDLHN